MPADLTVINADSRKKGKEEAALGKSNSNGNRLMKG
jgi:hypothetical protein